MVDWMAETPKEATARKKQTQSEVTIPSTKETESTIRSTLVVYSSRPSTSTARSTMFTTRNNHSIKQLNQYNQPTDSATRSNFFYLSQKTKTTTRKTKSAISITRALSWQRNAKTQFPAQKRMCLQLRKTALKFKQHANWMGRNPLYLGPCRTSHTYFPQLYYANYCPNTADKSLH